MDKEFEEKWKYEISKGELISEWGGCLNAIIDGQVINISDNLNEIERQRIKGLKKDD